MLKKGEMLSMQMMWKKYKRALNSYWIKDSLIQIHCILSIFMAMEIMAKPRQFFF